MLPKKHENGDLTVPMGGEAEDGSLVDGMVRIGPDHPDYQDWVDWMAKHPEETSEG